MLDICIIGHMCVDVMIKPLERLPPKGQLIFLDNFHVSPGGCGLNPAVYLSKMGIKTAILGKTGSDYLGNIIISTFKEAEVDYEGLKRVSEEGTSGTLVAIDKTGERTLMHYLGTNGTLCFEDINLDYISNTKVLFIGGTFIIPRFDGEDTAKILKLAKEKNVLCVLDTAWDASGQWMSKIEISLEYLDWFMPSYEEAVQLSGKTELEHISEEFFKKGVKNVIVKLGADGCFVREKDKKSYYVPALKNFAVKDTSGAGDAFCAGFLSGLIRGETVQRSAELGNVVGALCVSEIGTTTAARSWDEVLQFEKDHQD